MIVRADNGILYEMIDLLWDELWWPVFWKTLIWASKEPFGVGLYGSSQSEMSAVYYLRMVSEVKTEIKHKRTRFSQTKQNKVELVFISIALNWSTTCDTEQRAPKMRTNYNHFLFIAAVYPHPSIPPASRSTKQNVLSPCFFFFYH